ncbi:MAG: cytochrome c-type biogenesis protein CcmH [Alphaproteobacteria bacterium]|nr:cytochrome c-type biogenesis protein CcmH [Alphaproteobacteria bacterium]
MKNLIRALAACLLLAALPAGAVDPSEVIADPAQEARARDISRNLRCLVCQNQSIDDSDAQLARDLRLLVRDRIKAGDSDTAVIDYVVSRYGDFVLLKPPFKAVTVVLWLGPAAIALGALAAGFAFYRRRERGGTKAPQPLTEQEKRRLAALLDKDRGNP